MMFFTLFGLFQKALLFELKRLKEGNETSVCWDPQGEEILHAQRV